MTSTFLSYRLYAANLTQSLQRIAAEPANANDQKYFEANIGKVKNADDFLNNYRLFTYAMKAYGLSDLGNAKALMKQVIESDLSDTNSVANRLNDSRYKDFAKAFNFSTSGAVGSSGQLQTSGQNQDLMSRLNLSASAAATTQTSLSLVTSVKSFESNKGLYAQVLTAYGLDTNAVSQAQVTAALESNLSDPLSFANRPDVGNDTSYAKLRAIAADFNFTSNGSIGDQKLLQSAQSTAATQTAYLSTIPATADATTQAAAQDEGAYYAKKMPTLTSVDQLLADPRLVAYVKTAFGIDTNVTTQQLKSVLTSNLTDAKSAANTFGVDPTNPSTTPTKYQLLASAFSIGTDGTAWDHGSAMSSVNLTATTAAYTTAALAAVGTTDPDAVKAATTAAQTETDYFTATMPTIKSVTGLLADSRLVSYIRTAYNLPAPVVAADGTTSTSGTSLADLANILTSNLLDTTSVANVGGATTRKLDAAFNFASDGLVYSGRQIANASNVTAITTAYNSQAGTSSGAKAVAKTETDYFTSTLPRVKSVDDLLADKRLVAYISKAYNVPANTLSTTLRQVLTSNLLDPKSTANKLGGGYETLAAAFDISSDGSITHTPDQQVQSKTGLSATHTAFLNQAMETEAGAQNDGVRLALYFKRLASTITNPYQILADKALTAVVQTMLGLSTSSSNADIDSQARTITSKLKLTDLQDPAKVDKLVARFAALYDLKNAASSSSSG